MIQNYTKLFNSISTISNLFFKEGQSVAGKIQKLYSTAEVVVLVVRFGGFTKYFYIGRGANYQGLWDISFIPAPGYRVIDKFLEILRKTLKNSLLLSFSLDSDDRIFSIEFKKSNVSGYVNMFYKGADLYFQVIEISGEKISFFNSWQKSKLNTVFSGIHKDALAIGLEHFNEIGRKKIRPDNIRDLFDTSEAQKFFEKKYVSEFEEKQSKKKEFLIRKIGKIESDLVKSKIWKHLEKTVEQIDYELPEYEIEGIKFKFYREKNINLKKTMVYSKIKSLKRGEKILKERLEMTRMELIAINENKIIIQSNAKGYLKNRVITPIWSTKTKITKVESSEIPIDIYGLNNYKFGIGKDTTSNDYLRSKWANKEDIWFHLEGDKSPHIILKTQGSDLVDEEIFKIIASAMHDYSTEKKSPIRLIYTQVKNVKGIKGRPGAVTYKKVKYMMTDYFPNWKEEVERL